MVTLSESPRIQVVQSSGCRWIPQPAESMPFTPKKLVMDGGPLALATTRIQGSSPGVDGQALTKGPFAGLTICVTGLSREARKQVQVATERMGGKYSPDLHPDCTHLVVQSCSGRKFEHAFNYGVNRGLWVVTLAWFVNSTKRNERLDESRFCVTKSVANTDISESGPLNEIMVINKGYSCLPSKQHGNKSQSIVLHSTLHSEQGLDLVKNKGAVFSGYCFYVDPDLSNEVQLKVIDAVTKHGATCIQHWYFGCSATHVICEGNSLQKFVGYITSIVTPLWVLKTVKERSPQCLVHFSADLAMHLAFLLDAARLNFQIQSKSANNDQMPTNILPLCGADEREKIKQMEAAKADVRSRRGTRMQPCRTLPRPLTPPSMLNSICWSVAEQPSVAQLYTGILSSITTGNGTDVKTSGPNLDEKDSYDSGREAELNAFEYSEAHTRPMNESEEREIVYKGVFLTILFPIDRFGEMGPSSRTFFGAKGFTRKQILDHIHEFYKGNLSAEEIQVAIYTDSRHADRLRAAYTDLKFAKLGYVPVKRCDFIGSRKIFKGLKRLGKENTGQIYELCLQT
ncbi:hypothetical protein O6H91_23G066700 [Diphasiastrum complanatum]|uniref:Uncharacterized protein n=2 Tax=Diphasiastrum complanatum TaxID=34168 RepID=A0ACC2ABQ9_DIPCM|nr:hypothetical protein O6H91_23G066700 [Diphasiastrum complanatum]